MKNEKARSEFLLEVAHELQTPIAILKNNIEVLAGYAGKDGSRAASSANATLDRLSRLVRNLLDLEKLTLSECELGKMAIDAGELIWAVREDCVTLAEAQGIAMFVESDASGVALIAGDKDRLKDVVLNLVSNALKHTPSGGTITLRAWRRSERVEIAVTDTGVGIAPEHLPRIFERFYKIDSPGLPKGNGIGLHLCRRIIEAHGGTIRVESEPGKGSCFTLAMPLAANPSFFSGPETQVDARDRQNASLI